jgi:hypothetical protein
MRASAAVVVVVLSAGPVVADDACPKKDGLISGPVVSTKQVAKQIYIAIAKDLYPKTWRKYREIFVIDEGERWGVGQRAPVLSPKTWKNARGQTMETVHISVGGGALEMEIAKCDGAVEMHFSR